ncbi:MAG: ATP-binding protein [Deltaproteobacteria bacterium]|nr:ATP-binding protein [Deltaproteobacteria bacterium]
MKKLFTNDLSFRQIIQGNYLYADKTGYIYDILNGDPTSFCFLSRPRRFGKTLLLNTFVELFKGDRELFRGLLIDQRGYKFERHPVLYFNMAYSLVSSKEDLVARITGSLLKMARKEGVEFVEDSYGEMLGELLEGICDKYGALAVILVDEYDAPLTRHIIEKDISVGIREVMRDFYIALKTYSQYVRLAFVTGITRFAMTELDSGPNNFNDISLVPKFGGICGFTKTEMRTLFNDRFPDTLAALKGSGKIPDTASIDDLKKMIEDYYDGYNWLGEENVLNPYSLLRFFSSNEFNSYWPLTGQPSHLSALVRKNPLDFILPNLDAYPSVETRKAELIRLKPVPVLFHSGYLTIDKPVIIEEVEKGQVVKKSGYSFKIPNTEVRQDFEYDLFINAFDPSDNFFGDFKKELPDALLKSDSKKTAVLLHNLLSAISFEQHEPNEKHYHAVMQAAFIATGLEVLGQTPSSSDGTSDMSVFYNDIRFVMEVKYCKASKKDADDKGKSDKDLEVALDAAVEQVRSKDYVAPFRVAGKKISGVAIAVRGRNEVAVRFFEP